MDFVGREVFFLKFGVISLYLSILSTYTQDFTVLNNYLCVMDVESELATE